MVAPLQKAYSMTQRCRQFFPSRLHGHSWIRTARLVCALASLSALTACFPLAGVLGLGPSTVQLAAQVDQLKLMADGASFAGSGKTITDHAISIATGYDCALSNAVKSEQVCAAVCR